MSRRWDYIRYPARQAGSSHHQSIRPHLPGLFLVSSSLHFISYSISLLLRLISSHSPSPLTIKEINNRGQQTVIRLRRTTSPCRVGKMIPAPNQAHIRRTHILRRELRIAICGPLCSFDENEFCTVGFRGLPVDARLVPRDIETFGLGARFQGRGKGVGEGKEEESEEGEGVRVHDCCC